MYDTEESPLSALQVARHKAGVRKGWPCFRNEPARPCTVNPKGRDWPMLAETSNHTGASPNSSVDPARRGTGRTQS